jgi:hypothetical protein
MFVIFLGLSVRPWSFFECQFPDLILAKEAKIKKTEGVVHTTRVMQHLFGFIGEQDNNHNGTIPSLSTKISSPTVGDRRTPLNARPNTSV